MTEQAATYVEGFSAADHFEDASELLLGRAGSFSLGLLARAFPEPVNIGQETVSRIVDNRDDIALTGYSIFADSWGAFSVSWYDTGGTLRTLSASNDAITSVPPAAVGAGTVLVWTMDQDAPLSQLWCNATLIGELANDFLPPAVASITAVGAINAAPANSAGQGLGGLGFAADVLTADEIVEHFNACHEGNFFADGAFDRVWDARRGVPNIDASTATWLDELSGQALSRYTNGNPSMRVASDRPRFR